MAVEGQEIFDLLLSVAIGTLYGWVGWTIATRSVSQKSRMPNHAFATWWWGLAALTLANAIWTIVKWVQLPSMAAHMAYIQFVLLLIMFAFAGMLYYFLYLWSGRANLWVPISLFYLGLYIFFVYFIHLQEPIGIDAEGVIEYGNDLSDSALSRFISVFWLLPPIIAAGLYLTLIRKVKEPLLRFRIALVSSSIIVWFMLSIGSSLGNFTENYSWWTYVSLGISVTAAALTLIAYRPPAWVRQRFHLDNASSATTVQTQSLQSLPGTMASERDEEE